MFFFFLALPVHLDATVTVTVIHLKVIIIISSSSIENRENKPSHLIQMWGVVGIFVSQMPQSINETAFLSTELSLNYFTLFGYLMLPWTKWMAGDK